jgi:hypothetical protein
MTREEKYERLKQLAAKRGHDLSILDAFAVILSQEEMDAEIDRVLALFEQAELP